MLDQINFIVGDILITWEGIGFIWKITFNIFIKSRRFETLWVGKNVFYGSVKKKIVYFKEICKFADGHFFIGIISFV